MPKKHRLTGDFSPDYTVIGISTQLKGYKLAMLVNEKLGYHLRRVEDFIPHGKPDQALILYEDKTKDNRRVYYLLFNRHPEGWLLPAVKGIDAFLLIHESIGTTETSTILSALRKGQEIQAAYEIQVPTLKDFEIVLQDLEVHLLNIKKKKVEE
jgi:hypothetical protein